jgi:vancomycin resistance protein YoaR
LSSITTTLSRAHRKERERRHAVHLLPAIIAALVSFIIFGAFVAAQGPRVSRGTVLLGIDFSGMSARKAESLLKDVYGSRPVSLVLEMQGKSINTTLADSGLKIDFKKTIARNTRWMWWRGNGAREEIAADFDAEKFFAIVTQVESSLELPRDARFVVEGDRVTLAGSAVGQDVDVEKLKHELISAVATTHKTIVVPVKTETPRLTTDKARAMNINRLIGSYTTKFVIDGARSENIKLAASKMDGTIVAPGERFSFNDVVGPRDEEHGYHEAHVFVGDHIEDGFGGGVCQVSTTLYNTAVLANLEILERHNHSMTVDYVPLGRDAAVAYGALDFEFRNNTKNHLMVSADVKPGTVTFRIFGDSPETRIAIESKVLSKTNFETEVVRDPKLPAGRREVAAGKPGYQVVTYKAVMDGDRVVTRSVMSYSTYKPMKQVIKEGTRI